MVVAYAANSAPTGFIFTETPNWDKYWWIKPLTNTPIDACYFNGNIYFAFSIQPANQLAVIKKETLDKKGFQDYVGIAMPEPIDTINPPRITPFKNSIVVAYPDNKEQIHYLSSKDGTHWSQPITLDLKIPIKRFSMISYTPPGEQELLYFFYVDIYGNIETYSISSLGDS